MRWGLADHGSRPRVTAGGGKSLCYQLPAFVDALRDGPNKMTIVISPLVPLMVDQVAHLDQVVSEADEELRAKLGLGRHGKVAALLGTGQLDKTVEQAAKEGEFRILYMTEKKLFADEFSHSSWLSVISKWHLEGRLLLVAVDEAHVVLEWPEADFRHEYRRLGELRERCDAQITAPRPRNHCICW